VPRNPTPKNHTEQIPRCNVDIVPTPKQAIALGRGDEPSALMPAIITLSFTIGSWVLDFALAGQTGVLGVISRLSLTQTLRTFEQGLLSAGLVIGIAAAILSFCVLAAIWLHPGVPVRRKLPRSVACAAVMAALLVIATQIGASADLTEDRRNSFPAADQRESRQV